MVVMIVMMAALAVVRIFGDAVDDMIAKVMPVRNKRVQTLANERDTGINGQQRARQRFTESGAHEKELRGRSSGAASFYSADDSCSKSGASTSATCDLFAPWSLTSINATGPPRNGKGLRSNPSTTNRYPPFRRPRFRARPNKPQLSSKQEVGSGTAAYNSNARSSECEPMPVAPGTELEGPSILSR